MVSIKVNDGSTKPLLSHIQYFHKGEWKDIEKEEKNNAK